MGNLALTFSVVDLSVESVQSPDLERSECLTGKGLLSLRSEDRDRRLYVHAPTSPKAPWGLQLIPFMSDFGDERWAATTVRVAVGGIGSPTVLLHLSKTFWFEGMVPFTAAYEGAWLPSASPVMLPSPYALSDDLWPYLPLVMDFDGSTVINPDALGELEVLVSAECYAELRDRARRDPDQVVEIDVKGETTDGAIALLQRHDPTIRTQSATPDARALRMAYVQSLALQRIRTWRLHTKWPSAALTASFDQSPAAKAIGDIPRCLQSHPAMLSLSAVNVANEVDSAIDCIRLACLRRPTQITDLVEPEDRWFVEAWYQGQFGLGPEAPYLAHSLNHRHPVYMKDVAKNARRYLGLGWYWHASVTRAYCHALIQLAVSNFIFDAHFFGQIKPLDVVISPFDVAFAYEHPRHKQDQAAADRVRKEQSQQLFRARAWTASVWTLGILVWAVVGAVVADAPGALVGILARLQANAWRPPKLAVLNQSQQLADAMQQAVSEASRRIVRWALLEEKLLAAVRLGAVFCPETFLLVADARRRAEASECCW